MALERGQSDALNGRLCCLFVFPAPRIVKPIPKDRFDAEVRQQEILSESGCAGEDVSLLVDDETGPVEYELILSADQIAEGKDRAVIGRPRGDHLLAKAPLSIVIGRRRDVDNQLGISRERLIVSGSARRPDVFADVYAKQDPVHLVDFRGVTCLKVSIFVEHAVVGQVGLVVDVDELSIAGNRGRVVDVVLPVDESDDCGDLLRLSHDQIEGTQIGRDELGLEQEIFGRIARDCQLGKDDNGRAEVPGLADSVQDLFPISVQVTDGEVDLREGDSKVVHILSQTPNACSHAVRVKNWGRSGVDCRQSLPCPGDRRTTRRRLRPLV